MHLHFNLELMFIIFKFSKNIKKKNIIESLQLKAGEDVFVSVPDKDHIILKINKQNTAN